MINDALADEIIAFRDALFKLAGLHLMTTQMEARDLSAVLRHVADWLEQGLPPLGPVTPIAASRDTRPTPGHTDESQHADD